MGKFYSKSSAIYGSHLGQMHRFKPIATTTKMVGLMMNGTYISCKETI